MKLSAPKEGKMKTAESIDLHPQGQLRTFLAATLKATGLFRASI